MKKSLVKKSKKGFTLIELVVVIAILGILAAILIPVIGGFITRANDAANEANARSLYGAIAMALTDQNHGLSDRTESDDALPSNVANLYGTLPTDATAGWDIDGNVVVSATFNGKTYTGPAAPAATGSTTAATTA